MIHNVVYHTSREKSRYVYEKYGGNLLRSAAECLAVTDEVVLRKVSIFQHFRIAAPHIVILVRLFRTVEDAGPYRYGGRVPFCVSFLDTQSVNQETIKQFKPHNPSAAKQKTFLFQEGF